MTVFQLHHAVPRGRQKEKKYDRGEKKISKQLSPATPASTVGPYRPSIQLVGQTGTESYPALSRDRNQEFTLDYVRSVIFLQHIYEDRETHI